uniref:PCI domain-containing protein n=1 Tax=Arcella intermedia TaxID=1963864 RepID=A0A6B2L5Z9_9EUKA
MQLAAIFKAKNEPKSIQRLVVDLRPFFQTIPKAKTGKIVRALIDEVSAIKGATEIVIELCKDSIEWAEAEKRTFLRLPLQAKLASSYYETGQYAESLKISTPLLRELRKLDDKRLLVALHLVESMVYHAQNHLPKSRASLTAARTAANAIYCPPQLQAELDMQSGTLHAEEGDYKTGYSYFYEAYEGYSSLNTSEDQRLAQSCLKYMLLTKIMAGNAEDVAALTSGKLALQFADEKLESIMSIAKAYRAASLRQFQDSIKKYTEELEKDPVIHRHLEQLNQKLLEDNLLRIVSPFSQVEISHVAHLIELDIKQVEKKLSQMILDKKLPGILDQGNDCLIVFDDPEPDGTYKAALETITHIGTVVESLYTRANRLR